MRAINFQNYTLQKNWESLVQALGRTSLQDLVMNLRRSTLACLPVFLKRSPIHHPNVAEVMHHNYWLDNCVKIYVLMWLFSHIILAIQSNSPLFIPQCDSLMWLCSRIIPAIQSNCPSLHWRKDRCQQLCKKI